jgi:hypothetical protein
VKQPKDEKAQPPAQKVQERAQRSQERRPQPQHAQQHPVPPSPPQARLENRQPPQRLSQVIQQQRIGQQQRRVTLYVLALDRQARLAQLQTAQLQQQHRMAQYRVQQE